MLFTDGSTITPEMLEKLLQAQIASDAIVELIRELNRHIEAGKPMTLDDAKDERRRLIEHLISITRMTEWE